MIVVTLLFLVIVPVTVSRSVTLSLKPPSFLSQVNFAVAMVSLPSFTFRVQAKLSFVSSSTVRTACILSPFAGATVTEK